MAKFARELLKARKSVKYQKFITTILVLIFLLSGGSLFGKARIVVWVKDSFTKEALDSVSVYLMKKGTLCDLSYSETCYFSDNHSYERGGELYWMEFSSPNYLYTEEPGRYELIISAPGHISKTMPLEISSVNQNIELKDIFIDNIVEPANGEDLIPKVKSVSKGAYRPDTIDISKGGKLRDLIEELPDVVLDKKGQIFFKGELVETSHIVPFGKFTKYSGIPSDFFEIPVKIVYMVSFNQKELRTKYRNAGEEIKRGPLTMNIILKSEYSEFNPKENYGVDRMKVFIILGIILIVFLIIALWILSYRHGRLRREVMLLRGKKPVESGSDSEESADIEDEDENLFVREFVRRNINGASEGELKILEDFVRRIDPDFYGNIESLHLKPRYFHDALLIRLRVGLSECGNVLGCSSSALGMQRLRMFRSLEDKRGQERWEDYVMSFAKLHE